MPVAGALIGGAASIIGSRRAAKSARSGTREAQRIQQERYDQFRNDSQPWIDSGGAANTRLENIFLGDNGPDYSSFYKSPGYQFRLDEGMRGVSNSASGTSGINSGRTLKALQRYGSDYASGEFGKYIGSLNKLSGMGADMVRARGNVGQNNANAQGAAVQQGAQYQAAADIAMGKTIGNVAGGLAGMYSGTAGSSYGPANRMGSYQGSEGIPDIPTTGFQGFQGRPASSIFRPSSNYQLA